MREQQVPSDIAPLIQTAERFMDSLVAASNVSQYYDMLTSESPRAAAGARAEYHFTLAASGASFIPVLVAVESSDRDVFLSFLEGMHAACYQLNLVNPPHDEKRSFAEAVCEVVDNFYQSLSPSSYSKPPR